MIYWQLLGVYLKIGIFGFGGGYAMLSLIQYEVVDKYHWLTLQELSLIHISLPSGYPLRDHLFGPGRLVYDYE